jgi:O-antigen/teichoic acid export membrane protein
LVLLGLWWTQRRRLVAPRVRAAATDGFRTLLEFGLPTVPAEASVYALSVIDRQYIVHQQGIKAAGRYAIAIKVAGGIVFIVRAFQYAWPPLAYSVKDDAEAARLYGLVATYYLLLSGWIVAGVTLESRFIIRFLAPHAGYFLSYQAVPWVSLGWALYGLWVVLLVIAGRAKVTRRNFPAAIIGVVANVVLLVLLVPPLGIAGAGIALAGAYVAMLAAMHLLVRRAFTASFEWLRLVHLVVVIGGMAVAGELLLPTSGFAGLASRAVVFLAIPLVLLGTRFASAVELDRARRLWRTARARLA